MKRVTVATTGNEVTAWHALAMDDVVRRLNTNTANGLDAAEAALRLTKSGPNRLPEGRKQGPLMRFLLQFNNVLIYVLLAAVKEGRTVYNNIEKAILFILPTNVAQG